jgi:hypothetical protein
MQIINFKAKFKANISPVSLDNRHSMLVTNEHESFKQFAQRLKNRSEKTVKPEYGGKTVFPNKNLIDIVKQSNDLSKSNQKDLQDLTKKAIKNNHPK